jgi:hypothetical protein
MRAVCAHAGPVKRVCDRTRQAWGKGLYYPLLGVARLGPAAYGTRDASRVGARAFPCKRAREAAPGGASLISHIYSQSQLFIMSGVDT